MGEPAEEILRLREEIVAGLIVVGNKEARDKCNRTKRFFKGSFSEKVARYARCSMMVVRRDRGASPSCAT